MAESTDLWNDIEDKLKSLTSSLQSLPNDVREKALSFISKHVTTKDNARPSAAGEETSETSEQNGIDQGVSNVDDSISSSLPEKTPKSVQNGHVDATSSLPTTDSLIVPKKRGRHARRNSDFIWDDLPKSTVSETSTPSAKKRGRPPSTACTVQPSTPRPRGRPPRSSIVSEVAATKKSVRLPATPDNVKSEACSPTVRNSSRILSRKKSLTRGGYLSNDEQEADSLTSEQDADDGLSVILVPVDEQHLSAAMSANKDSNDDDDINDLSMVIAQSESDEYNSDSSANKAKKSGKRLSSALSVRIKSEPGVLSDADQMSFSNTSSTKKRGRPSKRDLLAKKELETGMSEFPGQPVKKAIGRPRFSSYQSGYIPKPKPFSCDFCGKQLATRGSLREHTRRHTGDMYMCDLCGQNFSTNSGFLLHKKYHSDDPEVYKCTYCKYSVSSQHLLDDHYEMRHNPSRPRQHTCYVCGKGFHTALQLEKHLVSHSAVKPYICDECDFATAYPEGLKKHKYNVHETADRRLFECELCHVKLRSRGTYNEHLGRHFNQRRKKCETCLKTFPTASQLASHRRTHSDPKIPCEVCGKLLRNKHKMKIHMFLHTGQKDFACPYCAYVTYVKHNLKKHCTTRHKVVYPPVEHPRMKKYRFDDVQTVTASLTDPVAVRCVRKIADHVRSVSENAAKPKSPDISNESVAADAAAESRVAAEADNAAQETIILTIEPIEPANVTGSPSDRETLAGQSGEQTITRISQPSIVSSASSAGGQAISAVSGQSSGATSTVPLFTVPLFQYGELITTPISSASNGEEKTFVTLTAAAVANSQTIVLTPTSFSSL